MKSWKRRFKDYILERGRDYYEAGLVGEVCRSNYGYEAEVEGSELYHVEIDVSNDGSNKVIQDMYCSCPYAEGGNNCKHMAAVLYKVENECNHEDVSSLVDHLSKEQLCTFVKSMIQRDPSVSSLLARFVRSDIENDLDYKKEVCDIFECHADGSGFVSYSHASHLFEELDGYLEDCVQLFMGCKNFMNAFELALFIFQQLNAYDIDDSDGYVFLLCQDCFFVWKDVYELVNDCEREYIHQRFFSMSMDSTCDFVYSDLIMEFLLYVCEDSVLLNEILKDVDCMIENANGTFHCVYRTMFESLHPVVFRLELMRRLHFDEDAIVEYMSKFHYISEVRQLEIDENRRLGNVKKTIDLLMESKYLDSNNPIWLKSFCEQLIDVYDGSGMREEYKQELIFYKDFVENLDLNYVFKLKDVCSKEEWKSYLDVILKRLDNISLKLELLNHERLYEDMMDLIVDSKEVMYMDQYESVLKGLFPERVLEFYLCYLQEEVEFVRNRKEYRRLMIYLQKISSIEGGYVEACRLANEWRHVYFRRRAMMNELEQAGF